MIYIYLTIPTTSPVFNDKMFVDFDNLVVKYLRLDTKNILKLHERKFIKALLNLEKETVVAGASIKRSVTVA